MSKKVCKNYKGLKLKIWGNYKSYIDEKVLTVFSIAFSLITIEIYVCFIKSLYTCL